MTKEDCFKAYAADFERAYADNDWSRIAPYFTADATYDAGDGSATACGREAILLKLQGAVDELDRKMDRRDLQIHSVSSTGDTVTADWTIRFAKDDLPLLEVTGKEVARFVGDAMAELHSVIDEDAIARYGAWMAAHGASLDPH